MNKIQNIILDYCYDNKPSDCEWTLSKSDLPEMIAEIKKAVLNELTDSLLDAIDDERVNDSL